ncbi:hypothetical protein QQ045_023958 [Rhodiola kirilowii]
MTGGNEDGRNKMGAERILGLVVAVVGCVKWTIHSLVKYSKLEEMRNMNAHIKRKDFLDAEAAKQAAEKPVS